MRTVACLVHLHLPAPGQAVRRWSLIAEGMDREWNSSFCSPHQLCFSFPGLLSKYVLSFRENLDPTYTMKASLVAQMVKTLPAVQGAWVRSLGWEDPLEKGMATPVLLPGESHGQRSLAGRSSSSRRVRHNRATHTGPMSVFTFQMRTESEALGGPTQA